jgi:aconitase A
MAVDGEMFSKALCHINTLEEIDYYKIEGILHLMLQNMERAA